MITSAPAPCVVFVDDNAQTRPFPSSIGQVDLKCLRSKGGGQAFGLAGEIHDHTILVGQLGMHLPLDQGESAADAMVSSGEVGEPIQVIDFASCRDLLSARAANAATRDGEMVPPAVVIESTFSGFSLSVIGSRPLLNSHGG